MNRKARRALERKQRRLLGDVNAARSKRAERQRQKAEKDRARYAKLTQERLVELIERDVRQLGALKEAYDAGVAAAAAMEPPVEEPHTPTQAELEDIAESLAKERSENADPGSEED